MLIYEALEIDHKRIKQLVSELIDAGDRREVRRSKLLVDEIYDELQSHDRAEEATLFSRMASDPQVAPSVVYNGFSDHVDSETLLKALRAKVEIDSEWKVLARKFQRVIEAHIEQEELEIFGAAQTMLSYDEAQSLKTSFERFKRHYKKSSWVETSLDRFIKFLDPRRAARLRSLTTKRGNSGLFNVE